MDHSAWFESWESLFKITVGAVVGYVLLIFFVRIVGKRSTAKMNNFDWIVTVAVGSILASMAILKDVTVADGALALGLLLGFQYLLTMATARWEWARRLFLASPTILYSNNQFHHHAMRKERISQREIISAIRESGVGSLSEVHVVTLESNAELSIVKEGHNGSLDTVEAVPGYEQLVERQEN